MTIRSMTGFARARRPLGAGEISVTVKSVNHRGLDIHVRGPEAAGPFEAAVRALVKSHVARGHVEVRIAIHETGGAGGLALNRGMFEQYLRVFREIASEHHLEAAPDLNSALRIPGMFGTTAEESGLLEGAEAVLLEALTEALHRLNVFREREGAELAADIRCHAAQLSGSVAEMAGLRSGALGTFQKRLAERLNELLQGASIDPQRLAQEAAILADRTDIGEELARLEIHSSELLRLLDEGGETGKQLDFLLQEMNRETNTILSKTSGAGQAALRITDLALAVKAAIEKIREQSLNLE
ncbi:MAG TPA: YicC/YloC family endoribonuclease [Bryobacteraceae bacterium]